MLPPFSFLILSTGIRIRKLLLTQITNYSDNLIKKSLILSKKSSTFLEVN